MKTKKIKSSIALKLNMPIVGLCFVMLAFIYAAYLTQDENIQHSQLHHIAKSISENITIAEQANITPSELRSITNILATKKRAQRIIVIQDDIIIDSLDDSTGNRLSDYLTNQEAFIYNNLNSIAKAESSKEFEDYFFYLKKSDSLRIFITLNKAESQITVPNILSNITVIFSAGMLVIFSALYLLQRRLLLSPLAKITQHLTKQSEDDAVSTIPFKGEDELGELVNQYNALIENKVKHDQELAETHQHIDGITNTAPVLLSYIGSDLHFRFVNQIHEDWFGIPIEVFVGNTLEDILGSQSFESIKPEIDKVLAGKHTSFESTIPYQYLEDKSVYINLMPNKKSDDSIDGFFVCIEDISEARRNESKLAEYAQRLEFREFALEEEKVIAERALKIKSEFLASMSHEIRTPMNGVLGMLHLLMETHLNEDQQTKATLAKTSAESLLNLINDILDFSKVESGKLEIEHIDFNLIELLENTTEGLSKLAEDKSISLLLDTSEINTVMLKGDPSRLRQVLNNLLSNAIKFTQHGEVTVTARLCKELSGQYRLVCEVSDTGIGIEQNKLDSIFDSFSQVDASTTRQYGGTGLGLAIARKLCQLMEGDIHASSSPNQGSKFTFTASLGQSEQQDDISYALNLDQTDCIILDANQANTENMAKQLSKWGAQAKTISSPEEAIRHLKAQQNSKHLIVFVNLELPEQSGLDFIKKVKRETTNEHLKCVLMSPLSFNQTNNQFNEPGMSGFFYRPVTKIKLFEAIRAIKNLEADTTKNTPSPIDDIDLPSNKRVLLVEDTPINQLVVSGILSAFDIQCDVANNGLVAIDMMLRSNNYDVIFMDCQMPEMDGYTATKVIREGKAGEYYRSIPIIAMTANAMKGDEEICLNAGMNDYISKPISAQIIKEKLKIWLV